MSIFNEQNKQPQGPTVQEVAQRLKKDAFSNFQQLLNTYKRGVRQFWSNPHFTPSEISAELGTDAAELFKAHGQLADYLESIVPGSTTDIVAEVGSFTVNTDGTVTIN